MPQTIDVPCGDWMETSRGRRVDPFDMANAPIYLDDIATALAKQCRYAGHCKGFYSVAEHSVYCSMVIEARALRPTPRLLLAALLHDAAECYMNDLNHPVKKRLADYNVLEAKVQAEINRRFNLCLSDDEAATIKDADHALRLVEARDLSPTGGAGWTLNESLWPLVLDVRIAGMEWRDAERFFLQRFRHVLDLMAPAELPFSILFPG